MRSDFPAVRVLRRCPTSLPLLAVMVTFLFWYPAIALADAETPPSESTKSPKPGTIAAPSEPAATPEGDAPDEQKRRVQRRQQAVSVATLLLGTIAVVGVVMMALTVVWGNRMRAKLRQSAEKGGRPDDLWYLRDRARGASIAPPSPPKPEERTPASE